MAAGPHHVDGSKGVCVSASEADYGPPKMQCLKSCTLILALNDGTPRRPGTWQGIPRPIELRL